MDGEQKLSEQISAETSAINQKTDTGNKPNKEDPLDPHKILKFEGTHDEKIAKLAEFKDKLVDNKEAMVDTFDHLSTKISENPDASHEELEQLLVNSGTLSRLTDYQIEALKIGLRGYEIKHKFTHKVRTDYPNDTELFEVAFRRKPKGKIEIIESPISLYFRCYDPEDYATVYSGIFSKDTSPNESQIHEADKSGGVFISSQPAIPGLTESITLENAHGRDIDDYSKSTIRHEGQHAIWRFFKRIGATTYRLNREDTPQSIKQEQDEVAWSKKVLFNEVAFKEWSIKLQGLDDSQKEEYLKRLLRNHRKINEERAKDEFLAFCRDGRTPGGTLKILTTSEENGGLYDYFPQSRRNFCKKYLKDHLDNTLSPMIDRSTEMVFTGEYEKVLESGARALTMLKNAGYSENKIIALFMLEPLYKWEKTAGRLLEARGLKPLIMDLDIHSLHRDDILEGDRFDLRKKGDKTQEEKERLNVLEENYKKRKELALLLYKSGRIKNANDYISAAQIFFRPGNSTDEYKLGEELCQTAIELEPNEQYKNAYRKNLKTWRQIFIYMV